MSDISIKSCGPINCELETTKSFLKSRKVASFCGLPTCEDSQHCDATSKSPFELMQTLEYCRRSNCVDFWNAASSRGSKQSTIPSVRTSRTLELPSKRKSCLIDINSSNQIFSSPECDQPSCPKKTKSETDETSEKHENEIQINICGPPECCSGIDLVSAVDFNVVCDLESHQCKNLTEQTTSLAAQSKRNEIYYCVSPSLQKELHLSDNSNEVQRYAKVETVVKAHLMKKNRLLSDSCRKDSKKKLAPIHRRTTFPEDLFNNTAGTEDIGTSFEAFRSNTTLASNILKGQGTKASEPPSNGKDHRKSPDLPQTPLPSTTGVELTKKISPITPFQEFPLSPHTVSSKEENIVKSYLSGSDQYSMASATKPVQITRRNPGEVNALLKAVYSISSADFPPTPVGMEASQHGNYNLDQTKLTQALDMQMVGEKSSENAQIPQTNQLSGKIPGSSARDSVLPKKAQNDEATNSSTCSPTTCDHLLGLKKWRNCCSSPLCPINDPTSSTYNFLIKVRTCCGKRKCQLATKICDIYEPLVKIEQDLTAVGDEQYHYLATDASTEAQPKSPVASSTEISLLDVRDAQSLKDPREELEEVELTNLQQTSSDSVTDQHPGESSRKTSTVSWSVPQEDTAGPSTSQEQIVSRATAAADKFRQAPEAVRHASLFGEIVRKNVEDPPELEEQTKKHERFKSQISNIQSNDSAHRQRCCSSLREKFKRKKKKRRLEDESGLSWRMSADEKRKTNINAIPVQEKSQQISNMLNKMY